MIERFTRREETEQFVRWLDALRDRKGRAVIVDRTDRFVATGAGDIKGVGAGVYELRIAFGPGYRIYFMVREGSVLLLLAGGDKASQKRDIRAAQLLAEQHVSRNPTL